MSTEPTTMTATTTEQQGRRWLRLALLGFTLVGPTLGATLERLRKRAETATATIAETAQNRQADVRERLGELAQESRERVTQQVQYLRAQAREFQDQSRQLRKAVRVEARQRRKVLEHAREAGVNRSQEMLKRGEELLEPVREHSRLWTFVGFGVGIVVAGTITYRIVRSRTARRQAEDESIELSPATSMNGHATSPTGATHATGEMSRPGRSEDGTAVAETAIAGQEAEPQGNTAAE
jgi:ElaB/YqjD/DUF883 family membrane-anchored ribosome-binding protein